MKVKDFLAPYTPDGFFILDSHDTGVAGEKGTLFDDVDFNCYHYNKRQNGKLKPGSFFLYRKPKGSRKKEENFLIYGGGIIKDISPEDELRNVTATIKAGFILKTPLSQGDPILENFQWKKKTKPLNGWKGFWNNYGINPIEPEDFWELVGNFECSPAIEAFPLPDSVAEEEREKHAKSLSDEELRHCAEIRSSELSERSVTRTTTQTTTYARDRYIAENAKRLAAGVCQLCGNDAPFPDQSGEPYLECHHIKWLSRGGFDTIENTVALCPNCHRKMHVVDDPEDVTFLESIAAGERES